jgi:hypothetical protein
MAVTLSNQDFSVIGDKRVTRGQITFDNSYPTGGEVITTQQVGLANILNMIIENPVSSTPTTRMCTFDNTNLKFMLFTSSDGLQIANGTDVSAFSARFEAVGW